MKKEFSILNTTKQQRQKYVAGALAINSLDAPEPTEEDKKMLQEYIEGKTELNELLEQAINKYQH